VSGVGHFPFLFGIVLSVYVSDLIPTEFDKRTHLGAGKTFPKLIQSDPLMSETMAKAVCSQLSQDLVEVVPKLDDYSCPVCLGIRWHPIRLKCGHPICSGCTVTMQLERKPRCPLCRENVIMEAGFGKLFMFYHIRYCSIIYCRASPPSCTSFVIGNNYFCYLFPIDDTFNVLLNVQQSMLIKIKIISMKIWRGF
jgi:hypothetical protein